MHYCLMQRIVMCECRSWQKRIDHELRSKTIDHELRNNKRTKIDQFDATMPVDLSEGQLGLSPPLSPAFPPSPPISLDERKRLQEEARHEQAAREEERRRQEEEVHVCLLYCVYGVSQCWSTAGHRALA
jgi:hypothetical protein